MTVIAWIVETSWPACVDATRTHTPADTDIVLLHITDPDAADIAHSAYAGLLGRGHHHRDPGSQVEDIATSAARHLLDAAAQRLGRPCQQIERVGRPETEVITTADGAELLVVVRDGDPTHLGPRSLDHAGRYIVDHAPCPLLLVWPSTPPSVKSLPLPPHPPAPHP